MRVFYSVVVFALVTHVPDMSRSWLLGHAAKH